MRTLFHSLLLVALCSMNTSSFAQPWSKYLKTSDPTFYDIKAAYEQYRSSSPKSSAGSSFDTKENADYQFGRWAWYWEPRVDVKGNFPSSTVVWDEWMRYIAKHKNNLPNIESSSGDWKLLGPTTSTGGYEGVGRITCMAFHPTDQNTFWVGTPAGGLWKTVDGGASWSTNTDNLPVLGVNSIVVDNTNPNVMYIATGDGQNVSPYSVGKGHTQTIGVLKSDNGGATWNTTGLSFTVDNQKNIGKMILHPTNASILLAATSDGIYKTSDAAATWTKVQTGDYIDIAWKPGDPSTVYATSFGEDCQVFVSNNTGDSWTEASQFTGIGRIALGVTPANPDLVDAMCSDPNSKFAGLYTSANSGTSFTLTFGPTPNIFGYNHDGSDNGGQGTYDLCYAISPANANDRFCGSINMWKTENGGSSWSCVTIWSNNDNPNNIQVVHADKHVLVYHPLNSSTLFHTCDGGIYKSTNGGTQWQDLTNGLGISQFYRIATSKTNPQITLGGLQDNGSKKFENGTWTPATGGDGMECIIDHTDPTYMYATYTEGQIYRSSDGFATQTTVTISDNIPGGRPKGAWVTPYIMDPANSATLYAGYVDVYKTTNRGDAWTKISNDIAGGTELQSMAIAPSNPQVLYVASYSQIFKTVDGGTSWNEITQGLPSGTKISYIAINSTKPEQLWVTVSGYSDGEKIYQSLDGGSTWTNISGTLPNLPANCIVFEDGSSDGLYVGMDVGVYYRNSSMNDWQLFSTDLPKVMVTELEIQYSSKKLRAATFGRGIWESDLYTGGSGIQDAQIAIGSFTLYPNPMGNQLVVTTPSLAKAEKITFFDYVGTTMLTKSIANSSTTIDVNPLPSGVYFIGLESDHYEHLKKIVKVK